MPNEWHAIAKMTQKQQFWYPSVLCTEYRSKSDCNAYAKWNTHVSSSGIIMIQPMVSFCTSDHHRMPGHQQPHVLAIKDSRAVTRDKNQMLQKRVRDGGLGELQIHSLYASHKYTYCGRRIVQYIMQSICLRVQMVLENALFLFYSLLNDRYIGLPPEPIRMV